MIDIDKMCIRDRFKIVILLVLAIPLGLMLGYGISWIAVFLFNRFIGLDHSIALSGKAVGISIFICVVTVFLGSLWSIRKINRLSPILSLIHIYFLPGLCLYSAGRQPQAPATQYVYRMGADRVVARRKLEFRPLGAVLLCFPGN